MQGSTSKRTIGFRVKGLRVSKLFKSDVLHDSQYFQVPWWSVKSRELSYRRQPAAWEDVSASVRGRYLPQGGYLRLGLGFRNQALQENPPKAVWKFRLNMLTHLSKLPAEPGRYRSIPKQTSPYTPTGEP